VSVGLAALVAGLGWKRSALTADGALAATAVGASTFGAGGWPAGLSLIAFFVTGSALSRRTSVPGELAASKGHRRDAVQVLANGGFGALGAALSGLGYSRGRGAALGGLAAAAADTWASEIGVRSPSPPRSIMTGDIVLPGTSGGVTPLGWAAATGGSLIVGLTWMLSSDRRPAALGVALVAGLAGSLADSVAGATIQAGYCCPVCGAPAESPGQHCGQFRQLVRGHAWVTNDVVNGIGTAAGAGVGALLLPSRNDRRPDSKAASVAPSLAGNSARMTCGRNSVATRRPLQPARQVVRRALSGGLWLARLERRPSALLVWLASAMLPAGARAAQSLAGCADRTGA
jgi:uncharacterized protein (TIGR00297 family)